MRFGAAIAGAISSILIAHSALSKDDRANDYFHFQEVTDPATRAAAIKTLNEYLRDIGQDAKIRDCAILLWSHQGRVEDIYGGVCELQTGHSVALCGDTGVGEFGLNEDVASTKDAVAEFVRNNCPGG